MDEKAPKDLASRGLLGNVYRAQNTKTIWPENFWALPTGHRIQRQSDLRTCEHCLQEQTQWRPGLDRRGSVDYL